MSEDRIPEAFERYKRKQGGPDADLIALESGGSIIILTEGKKPHEHDNYATLRTWLKAEVLEHNETMTLEYIMQMKEKNL